MRLLSMGGIRESHLDVGTTARRIDTTQQAGSSMLVNVEGGVFVTQTVVHERVVQVACPPRRTFLAVRVPLIMRLLSLVRRALCSKDVLHRLT